MTTLGELCCDVLCCVVLCCVVLLCLSKSLRVRVVMYLILSWKEEAGGWGGGGGGGNPRVPPRTNSFHRTYTCTSYSWKLRLGGGGRGILGHPLAQPFAGFLLKIF